MHAQNVLIRALGVIAVLSGSFIAKDVYAEWNEFASGAQLKDIQGYWAETAIRTAVSEGKVAILQLHRIIFIPAGGASEHSPNSVYASLFDEDQLSRGVGLTTDSGNGFRMNKQ